MVVISFIQQITTHHSRSTLCGVRETRSVSDHRGPNKDQKSWRFFLSICFVFANLELEPQKLIDALEFQSQLCFSWCMRKENRVKKKKTAFHHLLGLRRPNKSINLKVSVQSLGQPPCQAQTLTGEWISTGKVSPDHCQNVQIQHHSAHTQLYLFVTPGNLWFDSSSLSF